MVAGVEKAMQSFRSAKGAGSSAELVKACANLEKEVVDAKAMAILAKRSGVDAVRLEGKIIAAKKLLDANPSAAGNVIVDDANSVRESERSFVTRSDAFDSPASRPEPPRSQISHGRRDDSDAASLRSSVAARHEDQLRLRIEEIALRRRMKDIKEKAVQEAEKAEREAEKARREIEDLEVEMLAIRHKRVESEMDDRSSQSGASGQSVGYSIVDSEKRTKEWLDSSLINSPRHVASPCPSQSSLSPNPPPPSAALDISEAGFAPVLPKKKRAQKSAPKAKATTPDAKTTPGPIPDSKVAAPKTKVATPGAKTTSMPVPRPRISTPKSSAEIRSQASSLVSFTVMWASLKA